MPDDPHPATLDRGPAIDCNISVDARADLDGFPLSSGRAGRGLRTTWPRPLIGFQRSPVRPS
jgi:hypothetical protein